jgi:hypothetical protein
VFHWEKKLQHQQESILGRDFLCESRRIVGCRCWKRQRGFRFQRGVKTRKCAYDYKPEMSAPEVTEKVVEALPNYDLVILNFANPDMVGHTGVVEAGIKAVETIDDCVKARTMPMTLNAMPPTALWRR